MIQPTVDDYRRVIELELSRGKTPAELWPHALHLLGEKEAERLLGPRPAESKPTRQVKHTPRKPCAYLGQPNGKTVQCPTCRGSVQLKLFACAIYGQCTQGRRVEGLACCDRKCESYA